MANADAETLFESLLAEMEKDAIPIANVIGFAADTCNVMMGEHNSVQQRMKAVVPEIFIMRCICHTAHLCASYASQKLPRTIEELVRDVYSYFSHSAKRIAAFIQFQHFAEVEPHKLLRPCQTRWLSIQNVCDKDLGAVGCSSWIFPTCSRARSPASFTENQWSATESNVEVVNLLPGFCAAQVHRSESSFPKFQQFDASTLY